MKLKALVKNLPIQIKGSRDTVITGISANSKLVSPGNLFIAKKGFVDDGFRYVPEAIAAGASAVLTEIYDPSFKQITQLVHPDVALVEAALAEQFYQFPSQELFMVGLTGTNGKTTTAFIVKHLLDQFYGPCGLIGTIEYIIGTYRYKATRTTPDVISNHKMLRDMRNQGCLSAVMEVTSHALDQRRVEKIDFDIAIFSNLTLDHLDYHHTMQEYCLAKNKLFKELGKYPSKKKFPKVAVVNADSPWLEQIMQGCQAERLTYGIENKADLKATDVRLTESGTAVKLDFRGKTMDCWWPLIGRYNVYNCLSAIAVALIKGIPLESIAHHMRQISPVRGRLETVQNRLNLKIFVDFAHSDDALLNVLEILQEIKKGRMITVFGCGGDRDRSKRPKMAAVSERHSDLTIVTTDNPRSEDPIEICNEIKKGFKKSDSYIIELDRYQAIQKAIEMATQDDIILIAGKGHEIYQIFSHKTIEFDDSKVAAEICSRL